MMATQRSSCRVVPYRVASARRALTLLEVMLALAILGGALAVIGELTRLGARNAEMARDLATAQRLCENKMAEISAGLQPPDVISGAPVEELGDQQEWLYTVLVEPLQDQGMLAVWVTVEQNPSVIARPVSFTLVRWMIDPEMLALEEEESLLAPTEGSADEGMAVPGI